MLCSSARKQVQELAKASGQHLLTQSIHSILIATKLREKLIKEIT